jgi:AraC-like DNA-binding protein
MVFEFNIFSVLLLIFIFHLLVYAGMFWFRGFKLDQLSDKLMGSFLLVAALFVAPWMLGFAGWYNIQYPLYRNFLFYTPFLHGLLFGPLLFFYVKSITNFNFALTRKDWLHFLPAVFYLLWCVVVVVVDQLVLKRYYLMDGQSDPDFDSWYTVLQILSIFFYLFLSIRYYRQYRQFTRLELSFADQAAMHWLRNFLIAFAIIFLIIVLDQLLGNFEFFQQLQYYGPWYKYLSFAIVVYYIAINAYNNQLVPIRKLFFDPERSLQHHAPLLLGTPAVEEASYETVDSKINEQVNNDAKNRLLEFMENEKPFLDEELTLTSLAKKMGMQVAQLSKLINDGTGQNFNDFVNGFRVGEVIAKLKAGEQKTQTLLGIAFDSGFNSKATFNRSFKKMTGKTPKSFLQGME